MKLTEVNEPWQFKGKANSIAKLIASIKNGRFTLDGRHLVAENLMLSAHKLTSLVGCPQVVKGVFNCSENRLQTLEGGPVEVSGNYYCNDNVLVSLKGAPRQVKTFWCQRNNLETLENGPEEVDNEYNCSENKLRSLKGAPRRVRFFDCSKNLLVTLEGGPSSVIDYNCALNKLTSLKGCAEYVGGILICRENQLLTTFEGGPKYVGINVYAAKCSFTTLKNIHLHLPKVHSACYLDEAPIQSHALGLLRIKGLKGVRLSGSKRLDTLNGIINAYLPEGDIFACAMELSEAELIEYAQL